LKSKVTSLCTSAFNSSQIAAIANMRDDSDDRFVLMDQIHKITELQFSFPHIRPFNTKIIQFIWSEFEWTPCDFWDPVRISGEFRRWCEGFQDTIRELLSDSMPLEI
jgi:hypothetical protein